MSRCWSGSIFELQACLVVEPVRLACDYRKLMQHGPSLVETFEVEKGRGGRKLVGALVAVAAAKVAMPLVEKRKQVEAVVEVVPQW